jgi:hypothetical protein
MRLGFYGFRDETTRSLAMFKVRFTPQAIADLSEAGVQIPSDFAGI